MNISGGQEHTLEFLLSFDGHIHWYAEGYCVKFEIRRVEPTTSDRTACAIRSRCMTRRGNA